MNKKCGIYIAGGGKDAGKTTLSLGLVSHFMEIFPGDIAFTKPLGQKSTIVDGSSVGQDSYLLEKVLKLGAPVKYTAPFSTSSGAAERFVMTGEPVDLKRKIKKSYNYLKSKNKIVIVEGTGHPGVGSVFNLSNADVASLLGIPVILVLNGGIGSTIDRFNLSVAPFKSKGVKILGVIINKILPSKEEKVKTVLGKWFNSYGVPVLGYIPYMNTLSAPSLGVLSREMGAETLFLNEESKLSNVTGFVSAFGSTEEVLNTVRDDPNRVLVVSSGRTEVIEAVISRKLSGVFSDGPSAMILCGTKSIDNWIIEASKKVSLPLFRSDAPFEKIVKRINHKIFKVEPNESHKIEQIINLIKSKVDMSAIQRMIEDPSLHGFEGKKNILSKILSTPFKLLGKFKKQ